MKSSDKAVYRHTCGTWCIGSRPCTTCNPSPVNTT